MTVRKKLMISNVLMIVIPIALAVVFGIIAFKAYGEQYWDSLEEMYDDENGVYSAQSIVYAYKEELSKREWKQYAEMEEGEADVSIARTGKMRELEQQLDTLGYHFRIRIDGDMLYSSLTTEETEKIREYFEDSYDSIGSLTLSDEEGSIIKNTFPINGEECEIAAVSMADGRETRHTDSYIKKYIISFVLAFLGFVLAAIAGTNFVLSRLITCMIMKPLDILKKGTKEIADGNLEFQLDYSNQDEFGEVCREFEKMRGHLKESVDTQLAYEQYRRELIVGISHDLRTPLTSIKGYAEGLRDGIANTEEKRKRYYHAIYTRSMDMEALVESLSTFAKLENKQYRYQLETVNMDEYLGQLIRDYNEEVKTKNAVILYENHGGAAEASVDIQELRRVFVNLFENSIKYRMKKETVIRVEVYRQEEYLKILVADDGPGVPERELSSIFKIFYRGDESRTKPESGSGLGLAIVKQIIEGHHGTIRAYNEKGLVMEILLPVKRTKKEAYIANEENIDCRG